MCSHTCFACVVTVLNADKAWDCILPPDRTLVKQGGPGLPNF